MLEEAAEAVILLHRAGQLDEVVQPAGALGRSVGLEHGGVAALVEHLTGELGRAGRGQPVAPRGDVADQPAERLARLPGQLVGIEDAGGGEGQRHALGAGVLVQPGDRLVAEAALRRR